MTSDLHAKLPYNSKKRIINAPHDITDNTLGSISSLSACGMAHCDSQLIFIQDILLLYTLLLFIIIYST